MVVLTWNEERNIRACLEALGRQTERDLEVIVLDAASGDRTVAVVREAMDAFPFSIRLEVAPTRQTVGEARNLGVRLARADAVAFLSADAEPESSWAEAALNRLRDADLVFGRQIHAPHERTAGAAVRGLRYHFPDAATPDPERYASNVNAAIRRDILTAFPFGTSRGASAVDDVLLTRRAVAAGFRVAYAPEMIVLHHDVDAWRAELAKNRREGQGWGEHAGELGEHGAVLAWGALLVAAAVALAVFQSLLMIAALVVVLWMPAARRAWHRRREMPARDLALGVLASPPFDLAFLLAYLRGRLLPRSPARAARKGNEV